MAVNTPSFSNIWNRQCDSAVLSTGASQRGSGDCDRIKFTQRNTKDALLVLLPLMMTAILTGASTVLMDNPFNFANIIVIPILFGLGGQE
jgi:hypothetical protein